MYCLIYKIMKYLILLLFDNGSLLRIIFEILKLIFLVVYLLFVINKRKK